MVYIKMCKSVFFFHPNVCLGLRKGWTWTSAPNAISSSQFSVTNYQRAKYAISNIRHLDPTFADLPRFLWSAGFQSSQRCFSG